MNKSKIFFILLACFGLLGFRGSDVIPEMQECMKAHGSQQEYLEALKKYCDPGIIRKAMGLLVIKNPYVVKTEKEDSVICYTVEGMTIGTSDEIPADSTQIYKVCWNIGKVVSLEFLGSKENITDDVIPEMKECIRSHGSQKEYEAVLKKYCDPGILRQAMGLLVIKKPYVVKTETDGPRVCYTVEGRTIGTTDEIPSDVIQVYRACWEQKRVVSLKFLGPKGKIK